MTDDPWSDPRVEAAYQRRMDGDPREDLPLEDRVRCFLDELTLGTSFVELTEDGPRRLDPLEVTLHHD